MRRQTCALVLWALVHADEKQDELRKPYVAPKADLHFLETFDGDVWSRWANSAAEKYNGRFKVATRQHEALLGDLGLQVPEEAKHYGASAKFQPINVKAEGSFAVQFEAKFEDSLTCGGSYLKFYDSEGQEASAFKDDTRYVIMFGPDRCGATSKVHFILQHKSPVTGKWEEKHLKDAPAVPVDKETHLYGLVIKPDNSFQLYIDGEKKVDGSLLTSMQPPVNPPKEIDDPEDSKPADWVDEAKIDDPAAFKPDDWDEDQPYKIDDPSASMPDGWLEDQELKISDPSAVRPSDWDDEEDGEWEAPVINNPACKVGCGKWKPPQINNPQYKGKWYAPKIANPAYKGEWSPRQIDNPEYFVDETPYMLPTIDAVGIDIWTMSKSIIFDNIVVDSDPEKVLAFGEETWRPRSEIEAQIAKLSRGSEGWVKWIVEQIRENMVAYMVTAIAVSMGVMWLIFRGGRSPPAPRSRPASGSESSTTRKRDDSPARANKDEGEETKAKATEKKEEGGLGDLNK